MKLIKSLIALAAVVFVVDYLGENNATTTKTATSKQASSTQAQEGAPEKPQEESSAIDDATMTALVQKSAKSAHLSRHAKNVDVEQDRNSISLTINYEAFVDAKGDTDTLAVEFIRGLVQADLDPTSKEHFKFIHVCAWRVGLKTVSGKPGVTPIGCTDFNPYKDQITYSPAN